eukprot:1688036-Pyramimonas_sp.AAC.1
MDMRRTYNMGALCVARAPTCCARVLLVACACASAASRCATASAASASVRVATSAMVATSVSCACHLRSHAPSSAAMRTSSLWRALLASASRDSKAVLRATCAVRFRGGRANQGDRSGDAIDGRQGIDPRLTRMSQSKSTSAPVHAGSGPLTWLPRKLAEDFPMP